MHINVVFCRGLQIPIRVVPDYKSGTARVTAGGPTIVSQFSDHQNIPVLLLTLNVISSAASLFFTIKASIPFLGNNNSTIFFFGYVSNLVFEDYKKKVEEMSDEGVISDLTCQAHILAQGLIKKYRQLQISGYLLLTNTILVVILSLIIITNTQK